jgi:hypothetical protein
MHTELWSETSKRRDCLGDGSVDGTIIFLIPFYLQTVRVHLANGVTREACRGALSSTSPHLTGSKPCVSVGKMTY